jgi:hypothetical protein
MYSKPIVFALGLFIGALLGILLMALLVTASKADDEDGLL